jgi:ABC-type oligopeptide transport system substrate-binding subunit
MLWKRFFPERTHWRNRSYEQLLAQAEQALDPEQRVDLYRQANHLLVEESVGIPLAYFRSHLLVKPWVRHYPTSAVQVMSWKDAILEPHD